MVFLIRVGPSPYPEEIIMENKYSHLLRVVILNKSSLILDIFQKWPRPMYSSQVGCKKTVVVGCTCIFQVRLIIALVPLDKF